MANPARRGAWLFGLIILLLLLPSMLRSSVGFWHGLPPGLAVLALINRRRLFALIALPFIIALPAVLYYEYLYAMPPGVSLWTILFDSSLSETVEYLAAFWLPLLAWLLVCIGGAVLGFRWLQGPVFRRTRWRAFCLALICIPLIGMIPDLRREQGVPDGINRYFRDSYPWSIATGYFQASAVIRRFASAQQSALDAAPIGVTRQPLAARPRVVVLVIGESARRDRHHIYGYGVPTTPEMDKLPGLLAFNNMLTLYPVTTGAVPVILAKRDQAIATGKPEPDLVSLFSQAGYQTWWISNQAAMGQYDSLISIYATRADHAWFARSMSRFGRIAFDDILLPHFQQALAAPGRNKLIVLHLFGSHEKVAERYPAAFGKFADPYDDSILYTDHILGLITAALQKLPGDNALVYVSDHGLKLRECDGRIEHFDMKQAFEVPFYVWLSPAWITAHPLAYEHARSHLSAPLTTMNVLDSLVDLADLRYPGHDAASSVFTASLSRSVRKVHTFTGLVDYDDGVNDARCHLVSAGH